jgi:hypothetical protein
MVTDAEGELAGVIALTNDASKGRSGGRAIPIAKDLKTALRPGRSRWTATTEIASM